MKVYIYNSEDDFKFSFNKEDIIKILELNYNDVNLDDIEVHDIEFPECACILTDWNEWTAEFVMRKYLDSTSKLVNEELSEYETPEIHLINEFGEIDNEPFIFIQ